MELLHKDITEQVIGAAFEVHRILGYGFLEKVYQNAMVVELRLRGFTVEFESKIDVWYKGVKVGYYEADLFVNQCVMVELKVAKDYQKADEAQILNELKATGNQGRPPNKLRTNESRISTVRLLAHLHLSVFHPCRIRG